MKPVLRIDSESQVIGRYESVNAAGRASDMSRDAVLARCLHNVKNEFARHGYTFRFEEEWSKMTESEKIEDIMGGE